MNKCYNYAQDDFVELPQLSASLERFGIKTLVDKDNQLELFNKDKQNRHEVRDEFLPNFKTPFC